MKKARNIFLSLTFIFLTLFMLPMEADAADMSSRAGAVTVSSGTLNVRSAPSAGSAVKATLPKGSHLTLISSSGDWWYVEYADGAYGYCHEDYVTVIVGSPAAVNVSWGSLNVRSGAGTSYAKTASLPKGKTVIVLSSSGGWSRVLYHGTKTGYVSSAYLSQSGGNSAVSLSVPSYKQTDSRWANVTLGSSGKTIARIGCATTALAMTESYRTGSTITPAAMASRLSYTSSGSVYWPANYTAVTSSSGYLSGILSQLKNGRPVLFGAKNAYGGQHWVVITGYTGGSDLSASGFTINDPGSASRTNLQQFLNAYPYFYKYFYYA